MQTLDLVSRTNKVSWYAISGDFQGPVERYVVSTAPSRRICNEPELAGWSFTASLTQALRLALETAPFRQSIRSVPEHQVCVMTFLRGGLNFNLRQALHEAYGLEHHVSAFMSSQRFREGGRWRVKEDMYRKLKVPPSAVLLVGDVVATGSTLANGLEVLLDHVEQIGSSIRRLFFFTIGCHKLEKHLEVFDETCRSRFSDYEGASAVYLEGKFHLVDSKTNLKLAIPGTDLVKVGAVVTPEFALSQYDSPTAPLERCVIYDAGSRAFDVPHYLEDVIGYWAELRNLARRGWTLTEALQERWPDRNIDFLETLTGQWAHLDPSWRERLTRARDGVRPENRPLGAAELEALCDHKLSRLESLMEK